MFFYFSKILSFIINPFTWILFLFLFSYFTKKEIYKKKLFKIGLILLLFFTNNVIFLEFVRIWEPRGTKIENVKHYNIGIVLGGMAEYDNNLKRLSLRRGGDRIWQAIHLYHLGKIDRILISGANGFVLDDGLKEAEQFKAVLLEEGIPESNVLIETFSKNTYQNAIESKKILDTTQINESVLLITSAIHMRRSMACFKKAGFTNFDAFTTDHYTGRKRGYTFDQYLIPNVSVLSDWYKLIHEWVGYVSYKTMGYI